MESYLLVRGVRLSISDVFFYGRMEQHRFLKAGGVVLMLLGQETSRHYLRYETDSSPSKPSRIKRSDVMSINRNLSFVSVVESFK